MISRADIRDSLKEYQGRFQSIRDNMLDKLKIAEKNSAIKDQKTISAIKSAIEAINKLDGPHLADNIAGLVKILKPFENNPQVNVYNAISSAIKAVTNIENELSANLAPKFAAYSKDRTDANKIGGYTAKMQLAREMVEMLSLRRDTLTGKDREENDLLIKRWIHTGNFLRSLQRPTGLRGSDKENNKELEAYNKMIKEAESEVTNDKKIKHKEFLPPAEIFTSLLTKKNVQSVLDELNKLSESFNELLTKLGLSQTDIVFVNLQNKFAEIASGLKDAQAAPVDKTALVFEGEKFISEMKKIYSEMIYQEDRIVLADYGKELTERFGEGSTIKGQSILPAVNVNNALATKTYDWDKLYDGSSPNQQMADIKSILFGITEGANYNVKQLPTSATKSFTSGIQDHVDRYNKTKALQSLTDTVYKKINEPSFDRSNPEKMLSTISNTVHAWQSNNPSAAVHVKDALKALAARLPAPSPPPSPRAQHALFRTAPVKTGLTTEYTPSTPAPGKK